MLASLHYASCILIANSDMMQKKSEGTSSEANRVGCGAKTGQSSKAANPDKFKASEYEVHISDSTSEGEFSNCGFGVSSKSKPSPKISPQEEVVSQKKQGEENDNVFSALSKKMEDVKLDAPHSPHEYPPTQTHQVFPSNSYPERSYRSTFIKRGVPYRGRFFNQRQSGELRFPNQQHQPSNSYQGHREMPVVNLVKSREYLGHQMQHQQHFLQPQYSASTYPKQSYLPSQNQVYDSGFPPRQFYQPQQQVCYPSQQQFNCHGGLLYPPQPIDCLQPQYSFGSGPFYPQMQQQTMDYPQMQQQVDSSLMTQQPMEYLQMQQQPIIDYPQMQHQQPVPSNYYGTVQQQIPLQNFVNGVHPQFYSCPPAAQFGEMVMPAVGYSANQTYRPLAYSSPMPPWSQFQQG